MSFWGIGVLYRTGKGNHLVSCLVPKECVVALDRLANTQLRANVGIVASNRFLFPNVASNQHCGGWNALATVCTKANINGDLVDATNQKRQDLHHICWSRRVHATSRVVLLAYEPLRASECWHGSAAIDCPSHPEGRQTPRQHGHGKRSWFVMH